MSNRPSYKKLYLAEKQRREFYEKIKPELLTVWDKRENALRRLAIGMEHAFLA